MRGEFCKGECPSLFLGLPRHLPRRLRGRYAATLVNKQFFLIISSRGKGGGRKASFDVPTSNTPMELTYGWLGYVCQTPEVECTQFISWSCQIRMSITSLSDMMDGSLE